MAESVNSPLLTVAPVEPAGIKSAKNPNSAPKSSDNDDFSRVLDNQRSRDKAAEQRADAQASRDEPTGKALPPEGNRSADGARSDPRVEDGSLSPQTIDSESGTSQDGLSNEVLTKFTRDKGSQVPPSVNSGEAAAADQALALESLRSLTSPTAEQGTALSELPASAGTTQEVAKLASIAGASAVSGTATPAKDLGGQALTNISLNSAAQLTNAPTSIAGDRGDASLAAAQSGLQGVELARSSAAVQAGDALQRGVLGANDGRGASPQFEPAGLNRSTSDWLRAGMGSENVGRGSAADIQLGELARGTAVLQRGDSQGVAMPATTNVVGLVPTPAAAGTLPAAATSLTTALPEYSLTRAPDDVEFPGELTARMKTLVRDGVREARLHLHPAELGRLQVTVTTEGDQTKVAFTAENAAARDLIEQSMPKLREMLEQSGLQLAQSDVGHQDLQGEAGRGEGGLSREAQHATLEPDDVQESILLTSGVMSSRIDTYI